VVSPISPYAGRLLLILFDCNIVSLGLYLFLLFNE
jgi:hypothetical protein